MLVALHFTADSIGALQETAEASLVNSSEDTNVHTIHVKRVNMMP